MFSSYETFELIKELAKKRRKSLNQVEEDLGYGRNTLYKIKNSTTNVERISEIADYFNVSTDYLLGRTDDPTINRGDDDVQTFFRLDLSKVPEHKRADVEKAMEQYMRFLLRDMED